MYHKKRILLFSLLIVIAILFSACASPTPQASSSKEPIKVGGIFNLTGAQASNDVPAMEGVKLAVKEINAKGGVLGRQLDLRASDSKTDVTTATNIATQLVQVDKVSTIIGFCDTTYVLAAGPVAQRAGVPLITVWASGPIIPKVVGNDMFLVSYGDNVQAAAGAEYAYNTLGYRNAYLLINKGMDYTKLLGGYFKSRFEELGGKIVAEDSYDLGDTDFTGQITRLKTLNPQPDMLYIAAGPDEVGTVVKQVREAGVMQPIMGGDGYDTPSLVELAGPKNANDVYYVTSVGLFAKSPLTEAFVKAFKDEYGKEPEVASAALGYDAVYLLADAIKRAGSDDPKAIREALATTKDLEGVTGKITYPPGDGVPQKTVAIIKVTDGKLEAVAQVVPEKVPAP
jgi:branched-chain amino acid transport system substrate-binding protein